MSQFSRPRRTLLSSLIASCAVIAACGGGTGQGDGATTAAAQDSVSTAAASTVPAEQNNQPTSAAVEQITETTNALAKAEATDPAPADGVRTALSATSTVDATTAAVTVSPYVTSQNGHFYKNGERVRLWGINLPMTNLNSYAEIDNMVARLKGLGFNAVRLWPTQTTFYSLNTAGARVTNASVKGDGSELDRFDYAVAKLSNAGILVHMTMLHSVGLNTLTKYPDTEVQRWASAARSDAELLKLSTYAPYVSSSWRAMLKQHYRTVLARTNPYTGRTYSNEPAVSTWELINESRFVECSLAASCVQGLPSIAYQSLGARWLASTKWNPAGTALPSDLSTLINSTTGYTPFARFVSETFYNGSAELRSAARGVGGAGSGVAVQPFLFNTGPASPHAVAHLTYSRGDAMAMGAYRSPMAATVTGGFEGSPWIPATMGGKAPSLVESFRVKGKPFIIYETSFFRPYDYRSEWGPMMAAMALRQDWDAVFLYSTGLSTDIYSNTGSSTDYGTKPLPDPVLGVPYKDNYFYGFQHGGDPAVMASWSLAGRLVQSVKESPAIGIKWTMLGNDVFASPKNNFGYPAKYLSRLSDGRTTTMVVDFTWDASTTCIPCSYTVAAPTTFSTNWDTTNQKLTITAPAGTAVSGLLNGDLGTLIPGFTAKVSTSGFGVVGALNSSPTGSTAEKTLYLISKVENSGKVFNPLAVDLTQPYGAMSGMVSQGTAPLVYSGPSVTFSSSTAMSFDPVAFNMQPQSGSTRGGSYTYSANKGSFLVKVSP